MAFTPAAQLRPRAVVYDCMDELSAFHGAPRQMLEREACLLQVADIVLAGGRSLCEAKRGRHAACTACPAASMPRTSAAAQPTIPVNRGCRIRGWATTA